MTVGVVWRETELGSSSLGKNSVCKSENQEIGHRLRKGWLVILGLFLSLAFTGPSGGLDKEMGGRKEKGGL